MTGGVRRPWSVTIVGTAGAELATPEGNAYWRSFREDVDRLAARQIPRAPAEFRAPAIRPDRPPRAVVIVVARSAAAAAVIAEDALSTAVTALEVESA